MRFLMPSRPAIIMRSKAQVGVTRGVRGAELDALGLGVGAGDRDTNRCRAVALGVDQVDRSLESLDQAVVGVQGRVGEGQHCAGVVEDAADVPAGNVGQAAVAGLVVEQRLAVLPQRLVRVHTGTVITSERLGHEGDRLAGLPMRCS